MQKEVPTKIVPALSTVAYRQDAMEYSIKYDKLESLKQYMSSGKIKEELEECFMNKEQAKREAAEKEKDPLEQKFKELLQMLEDQERAFKGFRVKITDEMRERDNLLRKMNERIQMLEILRKITEEQEEHYMKKEECAKREATEREKDPSEQKVKELWQKLEDQRRLLEGLRAKMTEEIREREKTSAAWTEREPSEGEKELLKQKYKEMWQKVEDQEKGFEGFIGKMTEKIRKTEKTSAEQRAKREAAERANELLEQKVKELQEKLEDQERVSEELRVKMTEEIREREKTSAGTEDLAKREVAKWEKELLEQKVKELQQKLEDQERAFKRFRVKITDEMRERDNLLRKMNERIQTLECLLRIPEKPEEHYMKKEAEEQAKREAAEREKEPLGQKVEELQQKLENQERIFERVRVKMTEELNERKKTLAEEQAKREAAEREKESLEQNVKELQKNLEDQERAFEGLRAKMTEEIRESEKTSAEQAKREATERGKELFEQKFNKLQQKFEDQGRAFEAFRVKMTEEMKERDNLLRKMNERIQMLEVTWSGSGQ
ncbi:golgin subfamily A member 6-like protein 25 isoform X4 [Eubalaena glacialis]|uniref:golgin subfamily A member 6-like protein 25 isoform X4 n=1 Tax=Eubalaena glacialis TaxID=27606 RepID=UPI002A5A8190|nr:golgin subfamily A member 6-like protein 25 isoform X4 [Eubalaena glacialis]